MAAKIVQDENNPVPTEVIAEHIIAISKSIKKLRAGSLNERALVLLIRDASWGVFGSQGSAKPSAKQVKAILDAIESLEKTFLKPKKKRGG